MENGFSSPSVLLRACLPSYLPLSSSESLHSGHSSPGRKEADSSYEHKASRRIQSGNVRPLYCTFSGFFASSFASIPANVQTFLISPHIIPSPPLEDSSLTPLQSIQFNSHQLSSLHLTALVLPCTTLLNSTLSSLIPLLSGKKPPLKRIPW